MSDTTADPQGFIQFAKELEKALAPEVIKGRGPDKQKRKARKTGPLSKLSDTKLEPSSNPKAENSMDHPHLETRVDHEGLPALARYGEVVAHAEVLSMAIWGLKEMLGGAWPDTLTQE